MTREQAINYLISSGFTHEQVGEVVRALTYEPTTKNDLVVDCISRDSALKALDYDIKCFEFKRGVSRHMDDIAKLLNTIYETQVNNIKALPSVTPQEPRWIPVSERLPKAFESVNCTCHSLIDDREDWVIETVYVPQPSDSPYSNWGNIPMLNSGDCEVVAWVHRDIPKPYKAEMEVEE